MDIYENIVIGNFLYAFGLAMGGRNDAWDLPLSVNLLQQTPLDRSAGDVLVRGSRVMRLLEFKRQSNDDYKEIAKLTHLQRSLETKENADLISVSREVHWFISSKSEHSALDLKMVPYLDFLKEGVGGPDLRKFIDNMVKEAMCSTGDRSAVFSRYLDLVAKSQGSLKGSSGGLVVSVNAEGKMHYAVVEDLRELGLHLTKLHAIYTTRQAERQQQYEKQWSNTFSRSIEKGISR
jgi:hypothetical protein